MHGRGPRDGLVRLNGLRVRPARSSCAVVLRARPGRSSLSPGAARRPGRPLKHLLIDWREGEKWFWDTLVDADYGNNSVNWQWTAGSGIDAQMFVRIMAPLTQSDKFDAASYIREWVPELADLSDEDIHDPPAAVRPEDYPEKRIEHRDARERALSAWQQAKAE